MVFSAALPLFTAFSVLCWFVYLYRRRRYRLPPGPPGLPMIGNVFDKPKSFEWQTYRAWSQQYGSDIVHFEVLGTHYVVLNSAKAINDVLEKRSSIYADKPEAPMVELSGWARNWGLLKYGDYWRAHRRLFHQYFRSTVVHQYHSSSTQAVRKMLNGLRDTPAQFTRHIRLMAGANILAIMYAKNVESEEDPILALVEEAIVILSKFSNAGSYLVDSFPLLRHIPKWFPGASFKRDCAKWRVTVEEMYMQPYNEVKAALERGEQKPCILADMLSDLSQIPEGSDRSMLEEVAINTAGTIYAGASDTTTLGLLNFVMAMLMYPEVQEAAQKEIDAVIGSDRLPDMEDRDALPIVTALVKECIRWKPPVPLALPHKSTVNDEYQGYFIPAGSIVIGNAWAVLHDPERYPHPEIYDPARFLDAEGQLSKDVPDPAEAFGYVANILAVFSIEKPVDQMGEVIEPTGEYTSGLFSFPVPFEAHFNARKDLEALARV